MLPIISPIRWSPREVLAEQLRIVSRAAIFAAAALAPTDILRPACYDFEAEHDTDHVIVSFARTDAGAPWPNRTSTGCRWREPVYRTLRELALSYFQHLLQSAERAYAAAVFSARKLETIRSPKTG